MGIDFLQEKLELIIARHYNVMLRIRVELSNSAIY